MEQDRYYLVKNKAVPEVLLKVVEAKRLIETGSAPSVQEAADAVGISRSSFYKYKDDIFRFHDNIQGRTITLTMFVDDRTGLLAEMLTIVSDFKANILTIHQSIPINGTTSISVSMEISTDTGNMSEMLNAIASVEGIHKVEVAGRE